MKKCPYCAEEIQDEAIVCRYCGRDLQNIMNDPPPKIITISETKRRSILFTIIVIVAFLCLLVFIVFIKGFFSGPTSQPKASTATPLPPSGTINNPFPMRTQISFYQGAKLNPTGTFTINVIKVIRGNGIVVDDSWTKEELPSGMEWIAVQVNATLITGQIQTNYFEFGVTSKGQLFGWQKTPCVLTSECNNYPELDVNLVSPTSVIGWITEPVFKDDINPLLFYNTSTSSFFALK